MSYQTMRSLGLGIVLLLLPIGLRGQTPSAARPFVGLGGSVGLLGAKQRSTGGFGGGASVAAVGRRAGWPGLLRGDIAYYRFATFGSYCPLEPGSVCESGDPASLAGTTISWLTPLQTATRPFLSAGLAVFAQQAGGHASLDGGFGIGLGIGSLHPKSAALVEIRAVSLWGPRGPSVLLPLTVTILR